MKQALLGAAALSLAAGSSFAGGIDRSGQGVNILFEEGNHLQFTFSRANPSVTGTSATLPTSNDVAKSYNNVSFGYKHQVNDHIDIALIYDQPYGAHIAYTDGPFAGGQANIASDALTALIQYRFDNGFSVHGGIRGQKLDGSITSGLGLLDASSDYDVGGVIGVAYEKPEIALRVALTYASGITSGFSGTQNVVNARDFDVKFPDSLNLDFQTGVAANTLVFGTIRWVGWDGFNLTTTDGTWVDFTEDTVTYSIGVGQRINDKLSVALRLGYEKSGKSPTTSLLSPTNGSTSIGLAATYQVTEQLEVSAGLTYALPGDQYYAVGGPHTVQFNDSSAIGGGIRIGYSF